MNQLDIFAQQILVLHIIIWTDIWTDIIIWTDIDLIDKTVQNNMPWKVCWHRVLWNVVWHFEAVWRIYESTPVNCFLFGWSNGLGPMRPQAEPMVRDCQLDP